MLVDETSDRPVAANRLMNDAMNRSRPSLLGGFTLLELIVAITVMVAAAAVATPAFNDALQRHRIDRAAARVVDDLHLARRSAQRTGQTVQVRFSSAANSVAVLNLPDFERTSQKQSLDLEAAYQTRVLTVQLDDSDGVDVNGYGLFQTTGLVTLQSGSEQRTIVVGLEDCHVQ